MFHTDASTLGICSKWPFTLTWVNYTVGHKKRDTFIFVITLANIDRFS